MRIKVILPEKEEHVVDWPKSAFDFPKAIQWKGKTYESVTFDKVDENGILYEFQFSELLDSQNYPWMTPVSLDTLMYPDGKSRCECGANKIGYKDYTRQHSFWCPVYKDTSDI